MKARFKYIIILLSIALIYSSCDNEEFLEEDPRSELTASNLFSSPEGFENGLNALYALVRMERRNVGGWRFWGGNFVQGIMTQGTDDYYIGATGGGRDIYVNWGEVSNSTNAVVNNVWNWLYQINNTANTIINRAENPDLNWDSDSQKNEIIAQARLIRAWAYRHLINLWGDVPLVTQESSGENIRTDWTREPKANIMQSMEEDLLFAEENLPEVQPIPGRLSSAVAQHYLAELYLLMEDPASAETRAQAAIDNPNFSLITERYGVRASEPGVPFMDQFYDGNVFHNQGNTEVLWAIPHDRDLTGGGGNLMRRYWLGRYSYLEGVDVDPETGRGVMFYGVTKHAFELYESGDDRGSEYAIHRYAITNDGDTIYMTMEGKQEATRDPYWPSTQKWDDGDPTNPTRNEGFNDQPYLRLAETYLLLAEAEHLQGKNDEAAETLNTIRKRSNASEISASDVNIDFILDERTRELLTEEHRRYHLLRHDKLIERTRAYNSQCGENIAEKDKLFPIPQAVIDANLGREMEQNPGY